jgi:hypothetical protein
MIGLQEFALQQTEPDLQLIEPGGIRREPIEVHRQFSIRDHLLCWLLGPSVRKTRRFPKTDGPSSQHRCFFAAQLVSSRESQALC